MRRGSPATLCLSVWLLMSPVAESEPVPGAFDLLRQVRQTYTTLGTYSDLGEIEFSSGPSGQEQTDLMFFEFGASGQGDWFWRIHRTTDGEFEERVVWTDGQNAFVYRSPLGQYMQVSSPIAELAHSVGRGSYEALVVPLLLAGATEALEDPEAASIDGERSCGTTTCWVLSLSRMGGSVESELWIDKSTKWIHQIYVHLDDSPLASSQPTSQDHASPVSKPVSIRVRHQPSTEASSPFLPPNEALKVVQWEVPAGPTKGAASVPQTAAAFGEEITVALVTVVARIVDSRGEAIRDLKPTDLIAHAGPVEIPIQAIDWSSSDPLPPPPSKQTSPSRSPSIRIAEAQSAEPESATGRLLIFFLQINLEPSRIAGNLKILPDIERLLHGLHPNDRVAVVSYDSHLKLWLDFTDRRETTFDVIRQATSYGDPSARHARGISLLEHFDRQAAKRVATPERALQFTAEALSQLPGEKDMIFMGWGLGRYGAGGVRMTAQYRPAVRALTAARTTVFVLDVSQADYHSLEVGLQNVAAQTGGTYERTLHFASQAVKRLARTIRGHYVVTLDRSAVSDAQGRLSLRLRDKKGRVLYKPLNLG